MAFKKQEEKYTFLEPGEMPRAKASLVFAAVSLAIFLVSLLLTWGFDGKAGMALGALGLVGALLADYAFVIGLLALARRESRQRQCLAAAICSGLMAIVWLTVFLNGIGS